MPDLELDAALWVVADPTAAAVAAALAGDEPVVRLDLPGWRVALEALPEPGSVAVVLGGGDGSRELAAALMALGEVAAIELLLCDANAIPPELATTLEWSGRSAVEPSRVEVDGRAVLRLRLVPVGAGGDHVDAAPLLASLASLRPVRRRVGVSWRVGIVGAAAWQRLGGWVSTVPVPRDALGRLDAQVGHLDVLAVSPAEGWSDEDLTALVAEAHEHAIRVVSVDGADPGGASGDADWSAAADARPDQDSPRPVDISVVNPQGWRRVTPEVVAVVPAADPRDADGALAAVHEHVGQPVRMVGEIGRVDLPVHSTGLLRVLRDVRGVVDHPGFHRDADAHASWLVQLAAAAIPVVCLDLPGDVAGLLGDRLAGAIRGARLADLDDPDERERRTVLTRRAAWLEHTVEAGWRRLGRDLGLPVPRRMSFSLVLATNRPDFLDHALGQVARQTWSPAELVVALNGDAFGADVEQRIGRGTDLETTVLRVPEHESLGEVLNQACQAAAGDVITKWDDDDWYSPDHLVDLAMALDHAGAHLVGKAAEFVYLAGPDLTIRRFTTGAETGSRSIAGGTLTFPRDVWRDLGGFARIGVGEDQQIIGDVLDAGGTIHRTHGFGYLLHRHGRHAWSADDQYFVDQAESQRPGRDHEWTLT